jgi:L-ascorbate 6-phosphate lactonase
MTTERWYKKGRALLDEIDSTQVTPQSLAIWFLGQDSYVLKAAGQIIYIDPFFSPYLDEKGNSKREFEPPFAPGDIAHAHWVLCTHNHIDHLDPATLVPMAKSSPQAQFVVPAPHVSVLTSAGIDSRRIIGARASQKIGLKDSTSTVIPLPSAHEVYQTGANGDHLFLGYVVTLSGVTLYHSGDAVEVPDTIAQLKPHVIDVACLPINGADWKRRNRDIIGNMNAREAADVAVGCNADMVIPMHYDLFARNGENPATFVDYIHRAYPNQKYKIMVPGERFIYMK